MLTRSRVRVALERCRARKASASPSGTSRARSSKEQGQDLVNAIQSHKASWRKQSNCTKDWSLANTPPTLPSELYFMFQSHFLPSDTASLAFSSKLLKHYFGYIWPTSEEEDRLQFLQSLDEQLPSHQLCHQRAIKTIRQDPYITSPVSVGATENEIVKLLPRKLNPATSLPQHHFDVTPTWIDITWPHIQLAMRAHRYGEKYGIPPSSFRQKTRASVVNVHRL